MIQRMLAIWSLVPLPFLKPAWTSGSSRFTYCWSLAWRILSIFTSMWDECNCGVVWAICKHNVIKISKIDKTNVNRELSDVQAGFRKGRGTRDQIANIQWIIEKAREFQKNIYFCFIDYAKAFVWITINCGKLWKRWEYQTTRPASWETYMQVRRQQLELDMEQQTGSK